MRSWAPRPFDGLLSLAACGLLSLASVGCAALTPPAAGARAPNAAVADGVPAASPTAAPAASAAGPAGQPAPAARPTAPEVVLDPKQPLRSLPELKVENIGLHVGGGPNDAQTKEPFLRAIASSFPAFMDCYRKNEDPAQGGRFGIDLHIARAGGHPRLEQPRTALRGADFRSCLSHAFESIEFQKPARGPTPISYSLRFSLVEAP